MIHAVQLGHGLMGLVDEHQVVAGEVVEEGWGWFAGEASGEMAGVVFDAVAVADGFDHFQIKHGSLMNSLGFDYVALLF